jgi:hypothetical protein
MALHQVNNLVRTELDERNEQEAVLPSLQLLSSQSEGQPLSASIRMSVLWSRLIHDTSHKTAGHCPLSEVYLIYIYIYIYIYISSPLRQNNGCTIYYY